MTEDFVRNYFQNIIGKKQTKKNLCPTIQQEHNSIKSAHHRLHKGRSTCEQRMNELLVRRKMQLNHEE